MNSVLLNYILKKSFTKERMTNNIMDLTEKDVSKICARDLSNSFPKYLEQTNLATEALQLMDKHSITSLVVSKNGLKVDGLIHLHDLLKAGII